MGSLFMFYVISNSYIITQILKRAVLVIVLHLSCLRILNRTDIVCFFFSCTSCYYSVRP